MCEIVDIEPKIIQENEFNCIGAQYLMKDIDSQFWSNVENDSESLFSQITELNVQIKSADPSYHELQIWCADMWAVLWNGWKLGKKTMCDDYFKFTWATESEDDFFRNVIFHNAGIVNSEQGLFYKGAYHNLLPYNVELEVKEGSASRQYWNHIQEVAKKSVII
jgi:hypothetical protein